MVRHLRSRQVFLSLNHRFKQFLQIVDLYQFLETWFTELRSAIHKNQILFLNHWTVITREVQDSLLAVLVEPLTYGHSRLHLMHQEFFESVIAALPQ